MDLKKKLGEKIKRARKKHGYTQEQLAEMIDISSRNLSNIELGISYAKPQTLEKIITILKMSVNDTFFKDSVKSEEELAKECINFIKSIKNNRSQLEKVYKIIKLINE